jgi:magnesium chelatase family protein
MSYFSATLLGVRPILVEIEIDISSGLPFFQIVGLPDAILRESKTRVKSAILQGGFDFPYDQRVVLNLAPSKVKKEGSGFELGLAARILSSSMQIPAPDFNVLFLGELALDGGIRSIPEIEALAFAGHNHFSRGIKIDLIVVNKDDVQKISHLGIPVLGVSHLSDFQGTRWWEIENPTAEIPKSPVEPKSNFENLKFSEFWARHLMIAALGGHHYFLCGPPGTGKTFFAESLRLLLGALNNEPEIERRLLNSVFQRPPSEYPWAAPHHSASTCGILGGGNPPRAGAITRAHGGVLFLDELLEFSPSGLDSLREPIEKGFIEIFRAGSHVTFPSCFQLIAATNPCRCGHWKDFFKQCRCMPVARQNYQARMSGPFFDRFDVKVFCKRTEATEKRVSGSEILSKVESLKGKKEPVWTQTALRELEEKGNRQHFNFRTYEKVKRVATTIARLDGHGSVQPKNITEASTYQAFKGLESRI